VQALFEAIAAGATVVTPDRRLARLLAALHDADRARAGAQVWPSADCLPLAAFVGRLWRERADRADGAMPSLLGAAQERALWAACVRASGADLLRIDEAAGSAQRAFALLILHRMPATALAAGEAGEDVAAFGAWRDDFLARKATLHAVTLGEALGDLAGALACGELRPPERVVFAGFDALAPRERALVEALAASGARVECWNGPGWAGTSVRVAAIDREAECEAAARWARGLLERGEGGPIGVVVPGLESGARRALVERTFDALLGGDAGAAPPLYALAAGPPLGEHGCVRDAIALLRLGAGRVATGALVDLMLSPYVAGSRAERSERARLDRAARALGAPEINAAALDRLLARTGLAPRLARGLERLRARARVAPARQSFAGWSAAFGAWLEAFGWPGELGLEPGEQRAVEAFEKTLVELASLDAVSPPAIGAEALAALENLAADQELHLGSIPVPVHVVGMRESVAAGFSHLWVSGLDANHWPPHPAPNPFLPLGLQRRLGLPEASAESMLARAERWTARWRAAARRVVASAPEQEGDERLRASALIAAWPRVAAETLGLARTVLERDRLQRAAPRLERVADFALPALAPGTAVAGGARVIRDQAACPFRAGARHRLGAERPERPAPGLDRRTRGALVHRALEWLWAELGGHAALVALAPPARAARVRAAADRALAEQPLADRSALAALERERLVGLLEAWLAVEAARPPFTVVAREAETQVALGGLELALRVDRIDRMPAGELVIDYKSGDYKRADYSSGRAWRGPRPDDPQLPLYCVAREARSPGVVAGAAFAVLGREGAGFRGLAAAEGLAPGIAAAEGCGGWQRLKDGWRETVTALAEAFARGEAAVDPKARARTCRGCEVYLLCRIDELERTAGGGRGDGD